MVQALSTPDLAAPDQVEALALRDLRARMLKIALGIGLGLAVGLIVLVWYAYKASGVGR